MKKLKSFFLFALIVGLSNCAFAQTTKDTASNHYYYYYPELNVYSDRKSTDYWYYDSTASNWTEAKKLPPIYKMNKQSKKNLVYYNGTDVWKDNTAHIKRYNNTPPTTNGQ